MTEVIFAIYHCMRKRKRWNVSSDANVDQVTSREKWPNGRDTKTKRQKCFPNHLAGPDRRNSARISDIWVGFTEDFFYQEEAAEVEWASGKDTSQIPVCSGVWGMPTWRETPG